ncbi:hypothetical protein DXH78_11575 [Undibacter mobilis]|uniref:Uncharacterized protein n=1 Tax=Undibacter mobilis TaxID=2292256 RepID=A0A371BC56_9BRAD|nr:hypothetical protein DXH78_11575 [Undibacter mobilis]
MRSARPQTENSPTAIKAATLAALIDFAQARIEALVTMPAREGETLAEVPALEQPELPMPHPAAAGAPVMALVQQATARAEPPAETSFTQPVTSPQAKRKTATIIPIVEFDYRAHQAGRPLPVRYTPEESWTTLAPPFVAQPAMMPAMPEVEAPEAPAQAGQVPIDAKPEVETYELWLDPPPVTPAERAMLVTPASEAVATTAIEAAPDFAAPQAMTADVAVIEIEVADIGMTDGTVADIGVTDIAVEPSPEAAISTIETLMLQMEQAAAPAAAVKGHAETPDPLAPLMALSEEERIALFT